MDPGYGERIPNEILENILLAVPAYLIPLNKSWVCKKWTRMILRPQFWVRKLKRHGIVIEEKIWAVLQEFENNEIVSCLYYASLYQEHLTHQTPMSNFVISMPVDEDLHYEEGVISDHFDTMLMESGILVCRSHWLVKLSLKKKNIKVLPLLLKLLEARDVTLSVKDDYAFWNFSPRLDYLQILKGSNDEANNLKKFRGCLTTLEGLPESLEAISLSIGVDDQNVAIDAGFSRIISNDQITLHMKAGTNISNLPKIPPALELIVSGLEPSHILWMAEVTKKLSTNNKYVLVFLNYQLDMKSSVNLLNSIAKAGLHLECKIYCSSPTLSSDSVNLLNDLALSLWPNAGFKLFDTDNYLISHLSNKYGTFLEDEEAIDNLVP